MKIEGSFWNYENISKFCTIFGCNCYHTWKPETPLEKQVIVPLKPLEPREQHWSSGNKWTGSAWNAGNREKMGIMIIETLMMAILENHSSAKRAGIVEGTLYVVVTSFRKLWIVMAMGRFLLF